MKKKLERDEMPRNNYDSEIEDSNVEKSYAYFPGREPQDESQKELFTGGEWVAVEDSQHPLHGIWTNDTNPVYIARTCFAPASKDNAALIAASPDMYRALKDAIERMDRVRNILQKDENSQWAMLDTANLKLAIKKATPNK